MSTPPTLQRITVRNATPEDAETIHRFVSELAAFEHEPDAVEATPEMLREQMRGVRPPFGCLLAEVDGAPAGIALYFTNYSTWKGREGIFLEDLYVTPTYRRRGVARALFRELAAEAVRSRAGRLELNVLNWNQRAIDFYRALGASPLQEWTTYRLTEPQIERLANGS